MRLSKPEKEMLGFLQRYPNYWHSFSKDKTTLKTLGYLYVANGIGIKGLEINRNTNQMKLNTRNDTQYLNMPYKPYKVTQGAK